MCVEKTIIKLNLYRTGLIYDPLMTKHQNEVSPNHPEIPDRIAEPWQRLKENGLMDRCKIIEVITVSK